MWGRLYPHAGLLILANIILRVSCKGSLTFLIDDTSSMSDDISQVKSSVNRISDVVFNEKSSLIDNMVLVTFNDPDPEVRVVTNNRYTFKGYLDAVYTHNVNNWDCWEPSMKGLLLALDKSNRDSYIYVFTDAPAKDYQDGRYVKELCQRKQSQIVFVLTGRCNDYYDAQAFNVYFDIAHACSGLAFDVTKSDVDQVLRTIEETIKGNKTVITSTIVPAGVTKDIQFTIDDHTDYAIVSVSGRNVYLAINGPSAISEYIMWNNNGKVVKLNNAKPGTYVATVKGYTQTSVVIVGRTDFFFTHGFSALKPKSLGDTSLQPIADAKYSIEDETLIIRNPKVSDTNSYTCEAKNDAGAVSATFKTYIRQAPEVSGVAAKKVRIGTPASIECTIVKGEPKPKITWQFKDKSASKYVSIAGSETPLHLSNAKKTHAGDYKCVAQNNLGSDEHVTTLIVEFPPEIIKNSSTVEGIEGDLALRIPCDVVGVPKPVITWKLKGDTITPDSKYTIEDGALVIMKPTEKDSSVYTCEAKNYISTVSTTFQATVEKLPTKFGTEHFVYLLQGKTKKLKCDGYSSASQSVKWFTTKDAGIKEPYIQIADASDTYHDGNYTCRVSDKHGNTHTHTYVVDVGSAPEFLSNADYLSNWRGVISDITQNCDIRENAKPKPVVEWRFNGKVLTDFNSAGVGHYTCNVSNVHGSVQKRFDVKSSACLISRNLGNAHMQYMPLMLDNKGFWHKFENTEHFTVVEPEEKITLSCPSQKESSNTFKNFTKKSSLEAFCYKEDSFLVEGKIHKVSDLQCTNSIQPSVIKKKVKCSTETSELIRVGYNVPGFLEAYEVCFDTEKNMPIYTRIIMTETNNNGLSPGYNWYTYPGIGNKQTERGFTCKGTMSKCCYSKSQLVNAIDFNDGPAKKSTFIDPLNVIPVWLPCHTSKPSWENINDMVRSQLAIYTDIVTWSGTHTLQEKNGAIIPRYLWKVVRLDEDEAVAIVHVNDPKPVEKDIKCKTQAICDKYEDWFISSDKYTYCCSLPDFFQSFNIHAIDIGESMDAVLDKIEKST